MARQRLFINEQTIKKNGECAVYAIVQLKNKTIKINTGVSIAPALFDKDKNRIKGNSQDVKDANLIIDKVLSRINDVFVRYRLQAKELTPALFNREYENPSLYIDFHSFIQKTIREREMNKEITATSAKQHRVLANKLKAYRPVLSFAEIDLKFIQDFHRYIRKSVETNTGQKNMATFKTYLNIARRLGIIRENPFDLYRMKKVPAERVFLLEPELKEFIKLYESGQLRDHLHRTMRHFLFMCCTGIRISDFLRLEKSNIENGVLRIVPYKTRNQKSTINEIPLIAYAEKLIQDEGSKDKYLFESISEQKMNEQLKELAILAKVNKPISNHSARHTFATLFIEKTSDVASLQKILNHSKITETMIYVHINQKKIHEQMKSFEGLLNLK
jgi:integrase/recombinase XerD